MNYHYHERIGAIRNLSMDAIIEDCRNHIPAQYKLRPYFHPELNHGLDLLQSDEALDCYMGAYGEMHHSKCKAVLQNLPYPPEGKVEGGLNVEIVDWGCGQGIGAVSVIDFLKERDLTRWIKKVTLIEPSGAALNRAVENVTQATAKRVRVVPINAYLPADGNDTEIRGIHFEYKFVIHVFSNILDVDGIDLRKIAQTMAIPGHTHYVCCVGPLNANAFRMDRFCEIFQSDNVFSSIHNKHYGVTSDTNYLYTCKTKGFEYKGETIDTSKYSPTEKANRPVYGEYDVNLHISNGLFSNEKAWVYYRLLNILSPADLIYISPDINGCSPDFVIIRPNVGIMVISVFEENIAECSINEETNLVDILSGKDKRSIQNPYYSLENYQNLIIENAKEFTEAVIDNNRNLGLVKRILICTKGSKEQVVQILGENRYTSTYGNEFISDETISIGFFSREKFYFSNPIFDDVVLQKLKEDLSPSWHSYREGIELSLSPIQKNLAKSVEASQQKISGEAGSGKTQVLATRAVNAQIRTGGDVLLLTFNITLANYLKMRLSNIRADFPWDKIHIDYYHRFFKKYANKHNLRIYIGSYDEIDFFKNVEDKLPKFDAIFIDEVQDYMSPWLQLLRRYFLRENGEFVVFGDPKQNIYHRPVDSNGDILLGVIPGVWNKQLTKGHRFSNPFIASLSMAFQQRFIRTSADNVETETATHYDPDIFNLLNYRMVDAEQRESEIFKNVYDLCMNFIKDNNIEVKDVAILAPQTEILRTIDFWYRKESGLRTTITFVPKEAVEKISRHTSSASYEYKRDYDRLEKVKKNRFTVMSRNLKLSTIQSFKGWESKTVICIIQNDRYNDDNLISSSELVYTGITRAKENILIINIGNNLYDSFFRSLINN